MLRVCLRIVSLFAPASLRESLLGDFEEDARGRSRAWLVNQTAATVANFLWADMRSLPFAAGVLFGLLLLQCEVFCISAGAASLELWMGNPRARTWGVILLIAARVLVPMLTAFLVARIAQPAGACALGFVASGIVLAWTLTVLEGQPALMIVHLLPAASAVAGAVVAKRQQACAAK